MKKKTIVGLIGIAAIAAVVIFAGCVEKELIPTPVSPTAKVSATPMRVNVGENVSFGGMDSTDPDGTITSYEWDFGDGTTASGANVSHSYPAPGSYSVKLTVTDNDGFSDMAEVDVAIVLATIKIDVTSSTWREGEEPYDIYSAIKERLEEAGIEVASEGRSDYDALLLVDYEESKGGEYGLESKVGMGIYGTRISCDLTLRDKKDNLLLEYTISSGTSSTVSAVVGLYRGAINNFENKAVFKYLGDIIASKLGADDTALLETLLTDLESPDWKFRDGAAEALGVIGGERALDPLIHTLLEDDNINVVVEAAEALGKIGDEKAVEPLITTFNECEERFSWLGSALHNFLGRPIAIALGRIGGDRAIEALITIFLQDDDWAVRMRAAEALGNIGDERAIEPLTAALEDWNPDVQEAAREALDKINTRGCRSIP